MKTEKNILIAFVLNVTFAIFEFFGGILTNSVAIISDAIHDIGDAGSILISFILEKISKKEPDQKYTYGYLRYSVLGGLIMTVILFIGSTFMIVNSIKRIINPVTVNYNGMIIVALLGTLINFLAAYFTKNGDSINQKSVNLHMLEDVLGWIAVLIGSIVMKFTNINILDPIMSIIIAVFIFVSSLTNLINILNLFLEKVPNNIDIAKVKEELLKIKNIKDVHHIHVWTIDGINNCATMHVITNNSNYVKEKIKKELKKYDINHVTIEIEEENEECKDKECNLEIENNKHHHH